MGTFGTFADGPFGIKVEGQEITIKFEKTSPTTARISWTIPSPAAGCTVDTQAYNGIVVTLDTSPVSISTAPINGQVYTSDPTASTTLHAGDKIGTALVVGSFYDDKTTTSVDITGLSSNTAYYVSGYAVDNVFRYHTDGVHTYSLPFGNIDGVGTSGYHTVPTSVSGTDLTGLNSVHSVSLVAGGTGYASGDVLTLVGGTFTTPATITVASVSITGAITSASVTTGGAYTVWPSSPASVTGGSGNAATFDVQTYYAFTAKINLTSYPISILGTDAITYNDLIDAINQQIALIGNPVQNATFPNVGFYYYNSTNGTLFQWDGNQHVALIVSVDATDPTTPTIGDYWFDTTSDTLKKWSGTWDVQPLINYAVDPTTPECDDYWFDGTTAHVWDGATWVIPTQFNQVIDPSLPPVLNCPYYWYNSGNSTLYYRDEKINTWRQTRALKWNVDPTALVTGTVWFDETNNVVKRWDTPSAGVWNTFTSAVSATAPTLPATNSYWFNTTLNVFQQNTGTPSVPVWTPIPIILWATDPTLSVSGRLWWDTSTDDLYTRNVVGTAAWVAIPNFVITTTDPSLPQTMNISDVWYSPTTDILNVWDGSQWVANDYVLFATNPITIAVGTHWFNTTTSAWSEWNGATWDPIAFVLSAPADPYTPALNSYWFDTAAPALNQWNGAMWVSISYSTVPLTPTIGSTFFNTTSDILMVWNGTSWVEATPLAIATISTAGEIVITNTAVGANACVILTDVDLFSTIGVQVIGEQYTGTYDYVSIQYVLGTDGISGTPSYNTVGVGTDGSADERRELIKQILIQFGYPTVDVELSKDQLDFCVSRGLQEYRRRSGSAYRRVAFFLYCQPNQQHYVLSNKTVGFNKVVTVMAMYRLQTSFLGTAEGQGVFGQVLLQHLYQMGTFDLVSYHLVNEYIETLNHMFAQAVVFNWDEESRTLSLYKTFWRSEKVLVDAMIEKTEQDLLTDRWAMNWIQRWATGEAAMILAETRGKFQTLPGAGGGITLNSSDLRLRAAEMFATCGQEIDDYIANKPEDTGMESAFILG